VGRRPSARDYFWLGVCVIATIALVAFLFNTVWAVAASPDLEWLGLAELPLGILFWYCIIAGCWRRTVWSRA
jgi:hypothetical protein